MSTSVKVTSGYKILIPEDLIKKAHFSANDEVIVEIEEDRLILTKKTDSYTDRLRGLHKEVWKNTDTEEYLKNERDSWNCNAGD
jgi:bifunctional DNA-binding transcriptional regulator/antitoxin component of YhaV-PrlF toxin-antitoxin module